ncbi:FAD-dependent oxidoreductase [Streptomyces sp. NBC_01716]|uniref:FAD-dependent oxidoreductase n=1 Tax=Streptomyces sp. NBC_01716 TaxID=2975917 RepID=UPI002E369428|nr:FAD-dependent oxidoreductase [Streptomyces sp. NBC_01716]
MSPYRVAVVGSGPAGVYATEALVRGGADVSVDIYDRLPTPYGLVRYGVAPDHPRIKSIVVALQKVLERERVRFLGDVDVGIDLTTAELRGLYDAVVFATGASVGRRLSIPGEDLAGVCSATDVVAWYSGHPDRAQAGEGFPLTAESVVVVGAGNVALDVARLLVKPARDLAGTDMPPHVLERLARSGVRDVHLVCRRGPEHAKFTAKELRELLELDDVATEIDLDPLPADSQDPQTAANLRAFADLAARQVVPARRTLHFHFWSRPVELLGAGGALAAVRLEKTREAGGAVVPTGEVTELKAGMVVTSVGHHSTRVGTLPFDEDLGRVPHDAGRVLGPDGRAVDGHYVAGWLKRGPSGVVGTNRACAAETVVGVLADLASRSPRGAGPEEVDRVLAARGIRPVTYDGWLSIDSAELNRGRALGRVRTKIPDWETLRHLGATGAGRPGRRTV